MADLYLSNDQLRAVARRLLLAHLRLSKIGNRRTVAYKRQESAYAALRELTAVVFGWTETHWWCVVAEEIQQAEGIGMVFQGRNGAEFDRGVLDWAADRVVSKLVG